MAKIEGEIVIGRPEDVVFDMVADQRNEPTCNTAMTHSEKLTAGPSGVGTQFRAITASRRRPVDMLIGVPDVSVLTDEVDRGFREFASTNPRSQGSREARATPACTDREAFERHVTSVTARPLTCGSICRDDGI